MKLLISIIHGIHQIREYDANEIHDKKEKKIEPA